MRKSPWELLIEGDREAFISIYETNYQDLFSYGFSICGDKELTKDCIQDLFLEIWNIRSQLTREVTNVRSYLFTWLRRKITKALSRSAHIKNGAKDGADELLVELPYETLLIRFQQTSEDKEKLSAALSKLTKKQVEIIKLRFYDNLSYAEISQKTSLTTRTVYNHIHEAIRQLRNGLLVLCCLVMF
jgi:RNA polymerase sigma factor (sigma-70 family)